jgi:spore germination cell wall hydrolase CwlJ-like protein
MLTAKTILLTLLSQNQLAIDVDATQAQCLAENIYHEARGESIAGQFAVAHVTLNRAIDGKTVCQVVKQAVRDAQGRPLRDKCQFSWYCDGRPDDIVVFKNGKRVEDTIESFEIAATVAIMALSEYSQDNTKNATHYYNPTLASPRWARSLTKTVAYGNHKFMRKE